MFCFYLCIYDIYIYFAYQNERYFPPKRPLNNGLNLTVWVKWRSRYFEPLPTLYFDCQRSNRTHLQVFYLSYLSISMFCRGWP